MLELSEIQRLIELVARSSVAELDIEQDGWRIRIRGNTEKAVLPAPSDASETLSEATEPGIAAAAASGDLIFSSGYGVFHRGASPDDPPFVEIGEEVDVDQQVALVEAMKMFSAVRSPRAGRIAEILAESGAEVEAGAPLFRLA